MTLTNYEQENGPEEHACQLGNITSTTLTVTGGDKTVGIILDSEGQCTFYKSGYYRVIAIAMP
jgi:hypothetical protein